MMAQVANDLGRLAVCARVFDPCTLGVILSNRILAANIASKAKTSPTLRLSQVDARNFFLANSASCLVRCRVNRVQSIAFNMPVL
jgi:hypothetical protein